jgi:hypothetical protein
LLCTAICLTRLRASDSDDIASFFNPPSLLRISSLCSVAFLSSLLLLATSLLPCDSLNSDDQDTQRVACIIVATHLNRKFRLSTMDVRDIANIHVLVSRGEIPPGSIYQPCRNCWEMGVDLESRQAQCVT